MSRNPQLNVRLTREQEEVLAAAVYVRKLRSPQPLVEPLLESLVDELAKDPKISDAMKLRASDKSSRSRASTPRGSRVKRRSVDTGH